MSLFNRKESGQGLSEYALILALVAIVAVTALTLIGPQISEIFNQVTTILGGDFGKDIPLHSVSVDVAGDFDPRGLYGEPVESGIQALRVRMNEEISIFTGTSKLLT
jgi:pilus assembly protein Flp/PilA